MLVVLMYHRVLEAPFTQPLDRFEKHLVELSKHYPIISPGDTPIKGKTNLCLTFDDAYYDFYYAVFPLLKKLNIPATLAIPAGLIIEDTTLSSRSRLQVPYQQALKQYATHATLCTWREINEMVQSKLVIPASHGLTHIPLTQIVSNVPQLEQEIIVSKRLLQEKTHLPVETFIYPHGAMNSYINRWVRRHYQYAMRIGSTFNINWKNVNQVIYRVNAEPWWTQGQSRLTVYERCKMGLNLLSATLRRR